MFKRSCFAAVAALVLSAAVAPAAVVGISINPPAGVDLQRLQPNQPYAFGLRASGNNSTERITGASLAAFNGPGSTGLVAVTNTAFTADAGTVDLTTNPVFATFTVTPTAQGVVSFYVDASTGTLGISTNQGSYDLITPTLVLRVVPEPAGLAVVGVAALGGLRRRRRA